MLLPPFWGYGIIIANLGGGVKGENEKARASGEVRAIMIHFIVSLIICPKSSVLLHLCISKIVCKFAFAFDIQASNPTHPASARFLSFPPTDTE
jgi:hypothetical protein